ncbi:MAG: type IV pilin [Methanoregulaceae archaeon]|jgi:flagellin-like protein|nr:type IV pilin [Methanoregulaceae archaeon]
MHHDPDQAVSEVIGTVLMVAMVVMVAGIIAAMLFGMPFIPQKPTLASFSVEIIQVTNSTEPGAQAVPAISFHQVSGAEPAFFGANGTNILLSDPSGITYTVIPAITGTKIKVGEQFFVFRKQGSPGNFQVTNNQSSICGNGQFTPHGTWHFTITDEKESNIVILQQDLTL